MSTAPLLQVENLSGGYGDTIVLRGVSFTVTAGEVLGVIGRNGVGKTTLMRLLTGGLPKTGGSITFTGQDLEGQKPHECARLGMTYAPQENVVFDALTLQENLTLMKPGLARYESLLESFPIVRRRLQQKAGTLSGGEKKIVSLVRALGEGAPLTLLDEPTEGVQQENLDRMVAHVKARRDAGSSFIIVEQNLSFLMPLMHQVQVLDHGVVVHSEREFDRAILERHLRV